MPANIVILHTDQQRRDSLGCYGNPVARTPNLDGLAARGMVFDNHYAANVVCMPSRASFFTGRHVQAHGVLNNGYPLSPDAVTLPGVLAEMGRRTAAFGKLHLTPWLADAESGFEESQALWHSGRMDDWTGPYFGFQHVELCLSHGDVAFQHGGTYTNWVREQADDWDALVARVAEGAREHPYHSSLPLELHHSTWVADRAIDYIRDNVEHPFCVFAGFSDPHHPFTPPEPYASMYEGCDLPIAARREGEHDRRPAHWRRAWDGEGAADGGARRVADDELAKIAAATYGMVSLIDDCVGRVLECLTALGLLDDTLVVFTSDHGDFLGEHGLLLKGPMHCRSLLRVPFLLAGPGCAAGRTDTVMSNVDAMPTLLDLLDAPKPPSCQGRSYKDAAAGAPGPPDACALASHWSDDHDLVSHTLYDRSHRITWYPRLGDGELYDLAADPHELANLYDDPAHRALREKLRFRLLEQLSIRADLDPPPPPAGF